MAGCSAESLLLPPGKLPTDGLTNHGELETDDPARLPKDAEILAAVEKAGKNLQDLLERRRPIHLWAGDSFRPRRAFFHEIFGHRIEGHRQKTKLRADIYKERGGADPAAVSFGGLRPNPARISGNYAERVLLI